MKQNQSRDKFVSKFGVIAAAAGSAVGLGNIWRFPYVTGENGGGAFILIYIIFVLIIGVPAMIAELVIGHKAKRNAIGSFNVIKPKSPWILVGYLGVLTGFLILAFYSTVAGWTLHYTYLAVINSFAGKSPQELNNIFVNFHTSTFFPIFWQIIFMIFTAGIVIAGVSNGIEKYTKILMPVLFVILVILDIRAITLPGAKEGLEFLFKPDFSKLSSQTVLEALGQAFFSLSLGMGVLITYGSYIEKDNKLINVASEVAFFDTLVAILAGVAIFPAVFAFNLQPEAGPGLVFKTLPAIFQQMPGGYLFAILFFLLLFVAALTSSISLLEVVVAAFSEELKISRKLATIIGATSITVLGILATLSFGKLHNIQIFSLPIFDLLDYITSNILLPVGGFFIVIFVGWVMKKNDVYAELTNNGKYGNSIFNVIYFLVRYFVPIGIALVFLYKIGLF